MVKFLTYCSNRSKRILIAVLALLCLTSTHFGVPALAAGNGDKAADGGKKQMKFVVGPITTSPDKSGKGGNKGGNRPQDGSGSGQHHQ